MHEDNGSTQHPLKGTVLCGTALSQDVVAKVSSVGAEMGAVYSLDLTSEVTHLLVGSVDSEKYRHVAKRRPDILVLLPEWLFAVREQWVQGEEFDLQELNDRYRLPTFHSLKICVTGFTENRQRTRLEKMTEKNGGKYHGDLTKEVTHLVCAHTSGPKYDRAKQWELKLVSLEWFEQSLERGMILDEAAFDPLIEKDKQGAGAFLPPKKESSTKRSRDDDSQASTTIAKRKMRRTASTRLNSQSQNMWQDITTTDNESSLMEDSWSQSAEAKAEEPEPTLKVQPLAEVQSRSLLHRRSTSGARGSESNGLFSKWTCVLHGHDDRITTLLKKLLTENGAAVIEMSDIHTADLDWTAAILPSAWNFRPDSRVPKFPSPVKRMTEWWVERSIKHKKAMDPDKDLFSQALYALPSDFFHDRVISASGFGDDVRYIAKIVQSAGAKYEEGVSRMVTLLIFNYSKDLDKPAYCAERNIDVVTPDWLYTSLKKQAIQAVYPFMLPENVCEAIRHLINTRRKNDKQAEDGRPGSSKAEPKKQPAQRLSGVGHKMPTPTLALAMSAVAARPKPPKAPEKAPVLAEVTSISQERSNSPASAPSGDFADTGKADELDKENDEPFVRHESLTKLIPLNDAKDVSKQTSELLSGLIARRQNSSSAPIEGVQKRRLGRAPSNQTASSFAGGSASPFIVDEEDAEMADEPLPSQQLTYDAPGAEEYRRIMSKKMGTKFDDTTAQKVKSMGTVRDVSSSGGSAAGIGSRVRGRHKDVVYGR